MAYDSAPSTIEHIGRVRELLMGLAEDLTRRAVEHDASKLCPPEKPLFDLMTPRLDQAEYGTPAYKMALDDLRPALDHHYAHNRHHPEFFEDGVYGMTLVDLLEMVVDWKAAGERGGGTGDLHESIARNVERFKISPELLTILHNTAEALDGR